MGKATQSFDAQSWQVLAKQGDPEAIAQLLSQALAGERIDVQVGWKDGILGILVESPSVPNAQRIMTRIQHELTKLELESVETARVYGRQLGQSIPAWRQEIALATSPSSDFHTFSLMNWLTQGQDSTAIAPQSPTPKLQTEELRYLRFHLSTDDTALLPLSHIREIVNLAAHSILPIPHVPACVLGVCHHRGEMLWLVDVGQQIGFSSDLQIGAKSTLTAIAIEVAEKSIALAVSSVSGIETYEKDELQPPGAGMFPKHLIPYMDGYFIHARSPVLDIESLVNDSRFQVHRHS